MESKYGTIEIFLISLCGTILLRTMGNDMQAVGLMIADSLPSVI
jgi:hypothetical protein